MRKFFTTYNIICLTLLVLGIVFFCLIGISVVFFYLSAVLLSAFFVMLSVKFFLKYKSYEHEFLLKEQQTREFIIENYGEDNLIAFIDDIQANKKEFRREFKKYLYVSILFMMLAVFIFFLI